MAVKNSYYGRGLFDLVGAHLEGDNTDRCCTLPQYCFEILTFSKNSVRQNGKVSIGCDQSLTLPHQIGRAEPGPPKQPK